MLHILTIEVTHIWTTASHYDDVIMDAIASQITSLTIVYSNVYSGADQSKHQSSASLAFVWGIHRGPVNSPHKWPVTRKMFPFDDVIMKSGRRVLHVLLEFHDPITATVLLILRMFNHNFQYNSSIKAPCQNVCLKQHIVHPSPGHSL